MDKTKWEKKTLGEIGQIITGATPSTKDSRNYDSDDIPFFKPGDLNDYSVNELSQSIDSISYYGFENSRKLPTGTILVTCIGIIGKIGILSKPATCNQQINAIICNDNFSNRFIAYNILFHKDTLSQKANGPVVPIINKSSFSKYIIKVPQSITEQRDIAAELDAVQKMIEGYKAQLADLDTLAQSIFLDMFGDPITNPKGWETKTLSEIFDLITDGTHQTPIYTNDKINGIKFLSAKDVTSGKICWDNIKYIPYNLHLELHKRLAPKRGDILLCKNGTTGVCALVDTDDIFDIYVSLALLRTNKPYNKQYLIYAINNPATKYQFDKSLKGIGVPNLHLSKIKNVLIPVPPLPLQQQFAERVEAIERQKELLQAQLAEAQTLMAERMQYYFD